jgi:hypothetical protein
MSNAYKGVQLAIAAASLCGYGVSLVPEEKSKMVIDISEDSPVSIREESEDKIKSFVSNKKEIKPSEAELFLIEKAKAKRLRKLQKAVAIFQNGK